MREISLVFQKFTFNGSPLTVGSFGHVRERCDEKAELLQCHRPVLTWRSPPQDQKKDEENGEDDRVCEECDNVR